MKNIIIYSILCVSSVLGGGYVCPDLGETGSEYCSGDGLTLVQTFPEFDGVSNIEPMPVNGLSIEDIVSNIIPTSDGSTLFFGIKEIFEGMYDVYVNYDQAYGNNVCVGDTDIGPPFCVDFGVPEFEAYCLHAMPFALIDVTFVEKGSTYLDITESAMVDECCQPPSYADNKAVRFTFKIDCICPDMYY